MADVAGKVHSRVSVFWLGTGEGKGERHTLDGWLHVASIFFNEAFTRGSLDWELAGPILLGVRCVERVYVSLRIIFHNRSFPS